jgi:hypothetical protein
MDNDYTNLAKSAYSVNRDFSDAIDALDNVGYGENSSINTDNSYKYYDNYGYGDENTTSANSSYKSSNVNVSVNTSAVESKLDTLINIAKDQLTEMKSEKTTNSGNTTNISVGGTQSGTATEAYPVPIVVATNNTTSASSTKNNALRQRHKLITQGVRV